MAAGVPDRVDCVRLAAESAVLEREYALAELPRLQDVLAQSNGSLEARFAFGRAAGGAAAARVEVRAVPRLVCQRCLQGFDYPVSSSSEVEFSEDETQAQAAEHELYSAPGGMLSLRELAEEELLLALPIVAACATPERCGRAPAAAPAPAPQQDDSRRPFADLRNLMKKT